MAELDWMYDIMFDEDTDPDEMSGESVYPSD